MAKRKKKAKKSNSLQPLREQLSLMAKEANERASRLTTSNLALKEAKRTRPQSRKNDDVLFRGDIRNYKDLQKEYARITTFMSDWRSTEEGDEFYEAKEKYKGAFGGNWLAKYGETYDKSRINEESAKAAFDLYHRLTELEPEEKIKMLWSKDSSKISYGSENMIIAIYDMVIQGSQQEDIIAKARELIAKNELEMQGYATSEKLSEDYGQLDEDYITSTKEVRRLLDEYSRR